MRDPAPVDAGARAAVVYWPLTVLKPRRALEAPSPADARGRYVTSPPPAPGAAGCARAAAALPFPPRSFLIRG